MIKVLYFLTSPVRGGVEEHVLSMIQRMDRRRFAIVLVCPPALLAAFRDDLADLPVETFPIVVDTPTRPGHLVNLGRLYRFLRRTRPDIVNCHLLRATLIGAPLARLAGVRTVIATNHGPEPWRRGPIKSSYLVDRLVDRCIDRTIAVCQSAKDHLVRTKRLDPRKITVVHNGRDLSAFAPLPVEEARRARRELGLRDGEAAVGVVGRLDIQKGHRHLLDAMPEVLATRPNTRLVFVGEGNLRGVLEMQARQLGIAHRVVFAGFRSDVQRMFGAMDVVALPSLWEGLPLTVIEALATGKPMVASAVDGVLDMVSDGVTGLLVPPGDSAALAKGILSLLDDPDMARRLGDSGRAAMLERFDIRHQIEATVRVYEDCLRQRT